MHKLLLAAIATIFFATYTSAQQPKEEIDTVSYLDLAGKADTAIMESRWLDAETLLQKAMRMEPGNPTNILLMSNLGLVRLYAGKDSLALATLNDAHRIAPASVTVLKNRAKVLRAMGRDSEAYNDYTLILQLDSMAIEPRFMHGMMALYGGDTKTAETDFNFLNRVVPESENTILGLAALYSATHRHHDAIVQYTKLINRNPAPEYYNRRAALYLATKQLNEASADIAEALSLTPDDAELYLFRAYLNKLRYRSADAEADFKRAEELGIDPERIKFFKNYNE